MKDVEKVYAPKDEDTDSLIATPPAQLQLEDVIRIVMDLQTKVKIVETDLASVKRENASLKQKLSASTSAVLPSPSDNVPPDNGLDGANLRMCHKLTYA